MGTQVQAGSWKAANEQTVTFCLSAQIHSHFSFPLDLSEDSGAKTKISKSGVFPPIPAIGNDSLHTDEP